MHVHAHLKSIDAANLEFKHISLSLLPVAIFPIYILYPINKHYGRQRNKNGRLYNVRVYVLEIDCTQQIYSLHNQNTGL